MIIYEKYLGKSRDEYSSLDDLYKNFKITYDENFNFAYDVLDYLGTKKPDNLAMIWVSNDGLEKRITFREMMQSSNKAANFFKSLGIKKGDYVMLVLKRNYLFWYCMMALHKIGAVAVQATHLLTAKDYIYRCNAGKIKMAVITGENECTEHFDEGMASYETIELKAVTKSKNAGDGWIDFEAGFDAASDIWERPPAEDGTKATDTMIMSFSSGTTGYPKMVSHNFTYPLGHIGTAIFWHRVQPNGLHFTISDTGWLKSLWGKLYGQWLGESAIFTYDFEKFNADDILRMIEKYKVTTFCAPPTMYRFMLLCDIPSYDLSSLVHCCTAGEALSPDIFNKWNEFTGLQIYEGFGQSETTVCCATLYPWMQPNPGSMGFKVPGYEVLIADESGNEIAPGISGEICIRISPDIWPIGLSNGYYLDEASTAKSWRDGLYHTGDIAYKDELGFYWYVGRNDDIIKSSGYRIGPFEVESVLLEHPAVLEVAVTGVPDPVRGFNVKATIVPADGYTPSDELTKQLQNHVKKNTAPYKYPRIIEYVNSLPKTISGKIKRIDIRKKDLNN